MLEMQPSKRQTTILNHLKQKQMEKYLNTLNWRILKVSRDEQSLV